MKEKDGYVYSHESRCNGAIVAVLGYRRVGKDAWEYLVRKEECPPWGSEQVLCSLTGGMDEEGENPVDCAARELKEEGGYDVPSESLIDLGTCRGTKSSDTVYHLFAVDLEEVDQGEAEGDGTAQEEDATVKWVYSKELAKSPDPLLSILYMRTKDETGAY